MAIQIQANAPRPGADPLRVVLADIRWLLWNDPRTDERERAGKLWYAFARLEKILRQQSAGVGDPDGLPAETEPARETVLRHQEKVHYEYCNLLEQCTALKWELYRAAQPFQPEDEALGKTPPLRKTREGFVLPDYTALKLFISTFLDQIEQERAEAANLVLENLATDLGAGD